MTVKIDWEKAS